MGRLVWLGRALAHGRPQALAHRLLCVLKVPSESVLGGVGVAFWAKPGPANIQTHDQTSRAGAAMMIRVPVLGLAFHWIEVPLDTALEVSWAPYVVIPDLLHFDASLKVRYFF